VCTLAICAEDPQRDTQQSWEEHIAVHLHLGPRAAGLLGAVRGAVGQVHVQPPVAGLQVHRLRLLRALQEQGRQVRKLVRHGSGAGTTRHKRVSDSAVAGYPGRHMFVIHARI
jgi:hypothetical protein